MKIIHTSDWHLGHTLFNNDRQEEQADFLRQLADIVAHEQPDALIVSGDIYDTSLPSAAAQRLFTEGMLGILSQCKTMTVVITAGNHDSCARLESSAMLWQHLRTAVIGGIDRNADGTADLERHLIEICNAEGRAVGYVVAVPHVYPRNFPPLADNESDDRMGEFFRAAAKEARRRSGNLPVVMMAHLTVTGSDLTGHETLSSRLQEVGGIESADLSTFGNDYDYLALGHIHCPQTLKGSDGRARYCGSPLATSFDERYPHSVSVVEFDENRRPSVRTVEIANPKPLYYVPKEPKPLEEALEELAAFPDNRVGYVSLNVKSSDYLPGRTMERIHTIMEKKAAAFCRIRHTLERKEGKTPALTIDDVRKLDPLTIAGLFYEEKYGEPLSDEMKEMFAEAIARVNG